MTETQNKNPLKTIPVDILNTSIGFVPNVTIHTSTTEIYEDAVDIVNRKDMHFMILTIKKY